MRRIVWSASLDRLVTSMLPVAGGRGGDIAGSPALLEFRRHIDLFKDDLRHLGEPEFARMIPNSRETPTHFKWHLFSADDHSFRIWLHEHKRSTGPEAGYSRSIHNHRYNLNVLILAGGYRHSRFLAEVSDDLRVTDLKRIDAPKLGPGDSYFLGSEDFHAISHVTDGTLSLVVQWSSDKRYSVSVDLVTQRAVAHYPVEARLDMLRNAFQ